MEKIFLLWIVMLSALGTIAQRMVNHSKPDDFNVIDSIIYKEAYGKKLDVNFIKPALYLKKKSPLVIYIHGGGWGNLNKTRVFHGLDSEVVRHLLRKNIAVSSIEYNLNKNEVNTVKDLITDCKDAIRFWKRNGYKYNIDTTKIAIFGGSAGGHLTLMAGLGNDKDFIGEGSYPSVSTKSIKCMVALYPLTSFVDKSIHTVGNFGNPKRLFPLLGGPLKEKIDLAVLCSPVTYIHKNNPPILLVHGTSDSVLSINNSKLMFEKGIRKNSPISFLKVENAGHGLRGEDISPNREIITQKIVQFFINHLEP